MKTLSETNRMEGTFILCKRILVFNKSQHAIRYTQMAASSTVRTKHCKSLFGAFQSTSLSRLTHQGVDDTPAVLNFERTCRLPGITGPGHECTLLSTRLTNRLNSNSLLGLAGDSLPVGLSFPWPTILQVGDWLARAEILEDVHLANNELTSLISSNLRVEEGVDVGTNFINFTAQNLRNTGGLPDVESLSNSVRTLVSRALRLNIANELGELGSAAKATEDGFVADNEKLDMLPLGPFVEIVNLLLDIRCVDTAASSLDENSDHHLEAIADGSRGNSLEGITVSGVDTEGRESDFLDVADILLYGLFTFAASFRGIGSVDNTVKVRLATAAGLYLLGGGLGLNLGLLGGRNWSGSWSWSWGGSGSGGRSRSSGSQANAGVWAHLNVSSLGNGNGLARSSVCTRNDGGRGWVHDLSGLLDGGDDRSDGVGAGAGAGKGGHDNGAGGHILVGGDGSNGANHDSRGLDNGGLATKGVGSRGDLSGSSNADSGSLVDGDGLGWDGVDTGCRAGNWLRSRQNWRLGHNGRSDGGSLSLGAGSSNGSGRHNYVTEGNVSINILFRNKNPSETTTRSKPPNLKETTLTS